MTGKPKLRLVKGAIQAGEQPTLKSMGEPLRCSCGSISFVQIIVGPHHRGGRVIGGLKHLRCALCNKQATV